MRRLLPVLFCVAASTGLAACDQEPVSGPTTDEELELFNVARAANGNGNGNGNGGDGDLTLSRPAGGNGGGGDIIVFDIVGITARNGVGATVQVVTESQISSPDGQLLCTKATQGAFTQLRDADGDVLFSSLGPFVFDGQPDLANKNGDQQFQELASHLRFTFANKVVVEGFANSGSDLVNADVKIQASSSWRKVVIASLVDGVCGSDGLD